jgi:hypothetical protein
VCGVVVEKASREGGGRGFEPRRSRSGADVRNNGPSTKIDFCYLF